MTIYDSLVQTTRYARTYLKPTLEVLWRNRFVQVMGIGLCTSLLYYLAPRIRHLFAKKDTPTPTIPNPPPQPKIHLFEVWSPPPQPKIHLFEVWRKAEKMTPHPAEKLPDPEVHLESVFPDEVLI